MDIYEASQRFRIGKKILRDMEQQGIVEWDAPDPLLSPLKSYLAQQGALTVAHMVTLITKPELITRLEKHAGKARALLAELGKIEAAPPKVAGEISAAASGETFGVKAIMRWIQQALPDDREVKHHWLGVRLLLGVPENLRRYEFPRLRRVMLNIRKQPDFAGWFRIESKGSGNVTFYRRPFDL